MPSVKIKPNNHWLGDKSKAVIINGIHEFNITKMYDKNFKSYHYDNDCFSVSWKTIKDMKNWIYISGKFD